MARKKAPVERVRKGIAWTEITLRPTVDPESKAIVAKPSVKAGEKVTPELLGITNAEWDLLVRERIIRSKPYPSNIKRHEAPKQAMLRLARELTEEAERGGDADEEFADERMDGVVDNGDDNEDDENEHDDDDDDDSDPFADESDEERLIRLGMA